MSVEIIIRRSPVQVRVPLPDFPLTLWAYTCSPRAVPNGTGGERSAHNVLLSAQKWAHDPTRQLLMRSNLMGMQHCLNAKTAPAPRGEGGVHFDRLGAGEPYPVMAFSLSMRVRMKASTKAPAMPRMIQGVSG